jgi:hypothetical protein
MSKRDGATRPEPIGAPRGLCRGLEKNTGFRVRISSYRRPSRYVAIAIAAVIQLLAVVVLRVELPRQESADTRMDGAPPLIVSFLDLVEPSAEEPAPAPPSQTRPKPAPRVSANTGSAIQVAPPAEATPQPPPRIDFDMELKRASQAAIDKDEERARQAAVIGRRPGAPESLRPRPTHHDNFAWADRTQPRSPLEVPLNDRCSLVVGMVACKLGKVAARGDLFADMRKLKTPAQLGLQPSRSLENVGHETRRRLAEVSRLLGEWRAEHGNYPQDLGDLVANLPAVARKAGPRPEIVDTWDHKLVYNRPPHAPPCDYDLYSIGPNGVDDHGERDDIVTCGSTADVRF